MRAEMHRPRRTMTSGYAFKKSSTVTPAWFNIARSAPLACHQGGSGSLYTDRYSD